MSTVNILCDHHHYPELPLLSRVWSLPELYMHPLEFSSTPPSWSWRIFETLRTTTFRLKIPQRCSIGFKSGDMLGQSITFTLSLFSKAVVVLEVCLVSLSCWSTPLRPSFWREGIMLCCSISQYMLEFMFPSMKCNSLQHLQHSCSPRP